MKYEPLSDFLCLMFKLGDRDADLALKIGTATALEVRASGIHYTFAPCVAVSFYYRHKNRCYSTYLIRTGGARLTSQNIFFKESCFLLRKLNF